MDSVGEVLRDGKIKSGSGVLAKLRKKKSKHSNPPSKTNSDGSLDISQSQDSVDMAVETAVTASDSDLGAADLLVSSTQYGPGDLAIHDIPEQVATSSSDDAASNSPTSKGSIAKNDLQTPKDASHREVGVGTGPTIPPTTPQDTDRLLKLQEELESHQLENEKNKRHISDLDRVLESLKQENLKSQERLQGLRTRNSELELHISDLESQNKSEQVNTTKSAVDTATTWTQSDDPSAKLVASLRDDNEALAAELESIQEDCAAKDAVISAQRDNIVKLRDFIDDMKKDQTSQQRIDELVHQNRGLQEELRQMRIRNSELQAEVERKESRQRDPPLLLEDDESVWKDRYMQSCVKVTELIKQRRNLMDQLESQNRQLASKKLSPEAEKIIRRLAEENSRLLQKYQNLLKVFSRLGQMIDVGGAE